MAICPYYNTNRKECNFYDTSQEQYHLDNYCFSEGWVNCANYDKSTNDQRERKRLR